MSTKLSGTFTGTGTSPTAYISRGFNVSINQTGTATVDLERSFDDGENWEVLNSWASTDVSTVLTEPERGVMYRFNCTAYTSGTVSYRLGSSGL